MREVPLVFQSQGKSLVGIHHHVNRATKGVIIVVGGPQTRVGSHRQFVLLARELACAGISVFRFDYTGAGDSEGLVASFEQITPDIEQAVKEFKKQNPILKSITLWGLCDAASAILMYVNAADSDLVDNLVLLNPWVNQPQTAAQTTLKYYYLQRLLSKDFWGKIFRGQLNLGQSFTDLTSTVKSSRKEINKGCYVEAMLMGLTNFKGKVLIILSGNDYTAKEFLLLCQQDVSWKTALETVRVEMQIIDEANHTFSTAKWRSDMCNHTLRAVVRKN